MKLSKLILLIPAILVVACKTNNISSEEEPDKHLVSEKIWNGQINDAAFLKPTYNKTVTVTAYGGNESETNYVKMDKGSYEFHDKNDDVFYRVVNPDSYSKSNKEYEVGEYVIEDDEWKIYYSHDTLRSFAQSFLNYPPFDLDYSEFTYDEKTNKYVAHDLSYGTEEDGIPLSEIECYFEENDLLSMKIVVGWDEDPVTWLLETKDIGTTTPNMPNVQ